MRDAEIIAWPAVRITEVCRFAEHHCPRRDRSRDVRHIVQGERADVIGSNVNSTDNGGALAECGVKILLSLDGVKGRIIGVAQVCGVACGAVDDEI